MSVSRATFVAAAEAIRPLPEPERTKTAQRMAAHFAQQNPRFDRGRFLAACEVTGA